MRIGITGATGFIGGEVCRQAAADGHRVIAYSRRPGRAAPFAAETLSQTPQAPHALPETPLDALVHLAGESLMGLWTKAKRERIWKSRVELTQNMVRHLGTWNPSNRPKVLACASGTGFYGNRGDETLDESSPRGKGFLAGLCEQWEAAAREAEALGIRVVNLRTSMVLGNNGGAYPLMRKAFGCGLGGCLGSGRQWVSWVHFHDEVAMILWAVQNETVRGPINLCSPNPVTNAAFTQALAHKLQRPAFMRVPAFALRLLLRQMADEMLLCSQQAIPRVATEFGYSFTYSTLDSAFVALG